MRPFVALKPLRYLAALTLALAACSEPVEQPAPLPGENEQAPPPESGKGPTENTSEGGAVLPTRIGRPAAPAGALPFHLYVSNQSFDIDPAAIDIYIDDVHVVTGGFRVETQHNWILFDFELAPGEHTVRATSGDSQADASASFSVADRPWGVVNFWYYPASRGGEATPPSFGVDFFETQPGFD